jgi:hypothetical protein
MRVAKRSATITSERLSSAARVSAEAIAASGTIAIGLPCYLVLLGDALQSLPPAPAVRPIVGSAAAPGGAGPRPIRDRTR